MNLNEGAVRSSSVPVVSANLDGKGFVLDAM